jgi:hypothetical protein
VNVAGKPAAGGVAGPERVKPLRGRKLTARSAFAAPDTADTVAFAFACSVAIAMPLESVFVVVGVMLPAVVLNVTGEPGTTAPSASSTRAEILGRAGRQDNPR